MNDDKLLTTQQAARFLCVATETLHSTRFRAEIGLTPEKYVGQSALYRVSDVEAAQECYREMAVRRDEPEIDGERVYTIAQVARLSGLSRERVYQMIRKGAVEPLYQPQYRGRMVLTEAQLRGIQTGRVRS